MKYRKLGNSGLKLSELSFGSWVTFNKQVDKNLAEKMFGICLDAGINFFDNAEGYERGMSEAVMGNALSKLDVPRDSYCISSKVFFGSKENPMPTQIGLSRKHVTEACNQALNRLKVEYLDLYFCHRPDPDTPIEETVWAMHNLITQGKVLYWGTSEWSADQIFEAYNFAKDNNLIPPTMEQPQYNLLYRKRLELDYVEVFKKLCIGTTIWSPLASGILTGKYIDNIPKNSRAELEGYEWLREHMIESDSAKKNMEKVIKLRNIAEELKITLSNLSIAWCLLNKNVSTVILGASNTDQLKENISSIDAFELLNDEVISKIESCII